MDESGKFKLIRRVGDHTQVGQIKLISSILYFPCQLFYPIYSFIVSSYQNSIVLKSLKTDYEGCTHNLSSRESVLPCNDRSVC